MDFCRAWSWTLNNYNDDEIAKIRELKYEYLVFAKEVGEQGTPHLQGFVQLKSKARLPQLHKKLPRVHWEVARGSAKDNRTYIIGPYSKNGKEKPFNADHEEHGRMPEQGKRNDLQQFASDIKNNKRGIDLEEDHLEVLAKYPRLEQRLVSTDDERRAQQQFKDKLFPEVHVIWGAPGSGKSRTVYDKFPVESIYELNIGDGSTKSIWWDTYRGQDIILINDYAGELPYKYFLRFLDIYPFRMQTKGGHCWRLATKIYLTANNPPETWYPGGEWDAISRRLTSVTQKN